MIYVVMIILAVSTYGIGKRFEKLFNEIDAIKILLNQIIQNQNGFGGSGFEDIDLPFPGDDNIE